MLIDQATAVQTYRNSSGFILIWNDEIEGHFSARQPVSPYNIIENFKTSIAHDSSGSDSNDLYLLFTNWVQGPYQEIQAQGFSYSPSLRGLFGKPRACISWYGTSTQLVNSLLHDPF